MGEWIDSSDGGCPLFSYTFFSFAICLKACKILIFAYPLLSETLKVNVFILFFITSVDTLCVENNDFDSTDFKLLRSSQDGLSAIVTLPG